VKNAAKYQIISFAVRDTEEAIRGRLKSLENALAGRQMKRKKSEDAKGTERKLGIGGEGEGRVQLFCHLSPR